MLVDHHCHLDFPDFEAELDAYVARAEAAGVGILVTISTLVAKYDTYRAIAERYPNVYFTVGTHPHQADQELDVTPDRLAELSQHPKCVGIGEAGLDYFYKKSSPEGQADGLRRHIEAARMTGLPLEIHTRDADTDTIRILEDEMAKGPFKALLHCFTGGPELAQRAVALGLYVSFSGVITFKKSEALRAIAADVPLDRLLVETDAPFLAPDPHRGKRNEPAFVVHTAAALARVKGVSDAELATATTENFHRLYAKVPRRATGSATA
ncbi:MAG: TatD family hydrolase [Hyphomicrobiaceae bacterium]